MRVLLLESSEKGHRLVYLRYVIDALAELADPLILAMPDHTTRTPEFQMHIAPAVDRFTLDTQFPAMQGKRFHGSFHKLPAIRALIKRTRPDYLLVPHADGLAQATGLARMAGLQWLPRNLPSEGVVMAGAFAYPQPGNDRRLRAKTTLAALRKAPWTRLHHLDPHACAVIRSGGARPAERWRVISDPVLPSTLSDQAEARRKMGLDDDAFALVCLGGIDDRKGIDRLLRALPHDELDPKVKLALIGPHSPQIRQMLDGPCAHLVASGRVISRDEFVPHAVLADWAVAADVVCALYPMHPASSSIVILAAQAGRPVLGTNTAWIGRHVPRHQLGWCVDIHDQQAIAQGVRHAVANAADWQPTEASRRFGRFHTVDNFIRCWTRGVRQAQGLGDDQPPLTWDWVEAGRADSDPPNTQAPTA